MRRASIASLMALVALVAANLALLRAIPRDALIVPTFWIIIGIGDFLLVWKGALRRPLRAFHYAFLCVFLPLSIDLMYQVGMERLQLLGPIVRWYQQMTGDLTPRFGLVRWGEFWMACLVALLVAWFAGLLASRLERDRGWDIAAFLRGALAGFGVANLIVVLKLAVVGTSATATDQVVNSVILAVCVVGGGLLGLARLKSDWRVEKTVPLEARDGQQPEPQ